MSQAIKEQSLYAEAFREFAEGRRGEEPSWLARARAFARFEETGFPTTDEEEWKYTNVAPIARASFRPAAGVGATLEAGAVEPFVYAEARRSCLLFVNGFFPAELSPLEAIPPGGVVASLADARAGDRAGVVREHFGRLAESGDALAALNTAFACGGAFLHAAAGGRPRPAPPVALPS